MFSILVLIFTINFISSAPVSEREYDKLETKIVDTIKGLLDYMGKRNPGHKSDLQNTGRNGTSLKYHDAESLWNSTADTMTEKLFEVSENDNTATVETTDKEMTDINQMKSPKKSDHIVTTSSNEVNTMSSNEVNNKLPEGKVHFKMLPKSNENHGKSKPTEKMSNMVETAVVEKQPHNRHTSTHQDKLSETKQKQPEETSSMEHMKQKITEAKSHHRKGSITTDVDEIIELKPTVGLNKPTKTNVHPSLKHSEVALNKQTSSITENNPENVKVTPVHHSGESKMTLKGKSKPKIHTLDGMEEIAPMKTNSEKSDGRMRGDKITNNLNNQGKNDMNTSPEKLKHHKQKEHKVADKQEMTITKTNEKSQNDENAKNVGDKDKTAESAAKHLSKNDQNKQDNQDAFKDSLRLKTPNEKLGNQGKTSENVSNKRNSEDENSETALPTKHNKDKEGRPTASSPKMFPHKMNKGDKSGEKDMEMSSQKEKLSKQEKMIESPVMSNLDGDIKVEATERVDEDFEHLAPYLEKHLPSVYRNLDEYEIYEQEHSQGELEDSIMKSKLFILKSEKHTIKIILNEFNLY